MPDLATYAAQRPPRISFSNLRTGETVEMPYFPTTLGEKVAVNWARQIVLGMSHEVLQYSHTGNHTFDALTLPFIAHTPQELSDLSDGRRFLLSLTVPPADAQGVRMGAPDRVLFFWPQLVSMTCVISSVAIKHEQFNSEGSSVRFNATLGLEEIRDVRLTADDVRQHGTRRSNRGAAEG